MTEETANKKAISTVLFKTLPCTSGSRRTHYRLANERIPKRSLKESPRPSICRNSETYNCAAGETDQQWDDGQRQAPVAPILIPSEAEGTVATITRQKTKTPLRLKPPGIPLLFAKLGIAIHTRCRLRPRSSCINKSGVRGGLARCRGHEPRRDQW